MIGASIGLPFLLCWPGKPKEAAWSSISDRHRPEGRIFAANVRRDLLDEHEKAFKSERTPVSRRMSDTVGNTPSRAVWMVA